MTTAIVSDLHIGTRLEADVARRPEVRERLGAALADADHVVFLGDLLELRELPVATVLGHARPVLVDLAAPLAGKRVTVVAGNHDHGVVGPWLEQLRVEGAELAVDWSGDVAASPLATQLARLLPDSEVGLAYPGLQVRPDVYAFHGHYLDLHMALPRLECVLVRAMARRMLGPDLRFASPGDYERAVGPLYSLSYQLAQGGSRAASRFSNLSRDVWARAHSNGAVSAFLVGRMAVPAGVAALNVTGLGPYTADLTGEGLRRAGLEGIAEVLVNLGVEAEHVIFGHTHRHGPLPGEEQEPGWRAQGGIRLWNTGSWFLESALVGERRAESPYWPGGVIYVHDSGPPQPVNVLRDVEL